MKIPQTSRGSKLSIAAATALLLAALSASASAQSNTVGAGAASGCVTPVQTCATVPIQIARTDATPLLAFSVTFTLSSNLSLCSPPNVTEGDYLQNWNPNTTFQVRDLGNRTYAADGTILGQANCGAVASAGTLFNVKVTNAAGSGTGTITVTSLTLRDCSNATLASTIGSAGSVTIDLTPVTVAPIADPTIAENTLLTVTPGATLSSCVTGPASWTATGLPPGASIHPGTGVVSWTPDCLAYENGPSYGPVTVTAHAASGETGSASFTIHVTDNPGTVAVGVGASFSVQETSALAMAAPSATLSGCASGAVSWSVSPALPSGASFDTGTGVVSWTPSCGQAGSYGPFTLTAHAASGETGTGSFGLVVTHRTGTVSVGAISDPTVAETQLLTVTPGATLTACAATPVSWTATGLPAGAMLDAGTGVVSWTPGCSAFETNGGVYGPVSLTAHAATGETGSTSFTIHVTNTPGTVAVTGIADPQTVAELATLTVTPTLTLTGCASAPVGWTASGLPAGATIDPGTGVVSWVPGCAAFETNGGVYGPVTVTAHAAEGETGSATFGIHVTDTPVAISPVTSLATIPVAGGNGSDGLTGITVNFTPPSGATSIEVYRAAYGNYPEYDDAPNSGSPPPAPAYPPSGRWALTSVTASGQVDRPAARDFWYYVAFARNSCGDVSAASTLSAGALNYHLGDVTNGTVVGTGDNLVNTADISVLGSHYGLSGSAVLPYAYLDVGPTTNNWVDGRPLTDDQIDFEDLVIFAINYGSVSAPQARAKPAASAASGPDAVRLERPDRVTNEATVTARLMLRSSGTLRALSTRLAWDPAVVEPVSHAAGAWLEEQGGVAFSPKPGTVDAAALNAGIAGDGLLAEVTFRVLAPGNPGLRIESVDARDAQNHKVALARSEQSLTPAPPTATRLAPVVPNPFHRFATLAFSLARGGPVELSIYSVDGRRVKSLVREVREPGEYTVTWDGRDDGGNPARSGVYYVHLAAPQGRFTRAITYLR